MISNFLFYEDDASLQEKYDHVQLKLEIRELLKDDFNRRVLVEILLDLQKDISGDARKRLFSLYKDLGLHLDAFEKLKSWRWEIISQGIMELTKLQVEESYGFIKKFINHRRGVIRKQAQMATVSLKHEGIVYFLDTCKYRISEWQQLKLLDEIRNLEDFQPPRFKAWLTAKNKDVVLFSLRLIKYYKQNDANSSLVELVKHKNDQIKTEAINCIKEFLVFEAIDTLKAVFWKCSPNIRLVLLDTVASLGEEKEVPFLKMVESKESNFMVKSKAISAINTISPESVMPTHGIESVPDYDASQEILEVSPITDKEELADLTNDININEAAENKEIVPAQTNSDHTESDESVLDWNMETVSEDMITEVDTSDEALTEFTEPQEILTPEAEEEVINKDPEEVVMENREDIQSDQEEIFETLTNIQPEQQATNSQNSEEAYWEAVLDPEHEDEQIFEVCFMEELDEILSQTDNPQQSWESHEILPLNFLPIIANEVNEFSSGNKRKEDPIFEIEVIEEIVDEDEKIAEELERILRRVRSSENSEQSTLIPDFIPIVTDTEETLLDAPAEQIADKEQNPDAAKLENQGISEETDKEELTIKLPWEVNEDLFQLELERENLHNLDLDYEEVVATAFNETSNKNDEEALFELNAILEERVSIFNELFRTCDAESKLILLDEILAVGDERELKFLDTLSNDKDERVRKKAMKMAEKLKEYLNSVANNDQDTSSSEDCNETGLEPQKGQLKGISRQEEQKVAHLSNQGSPDQDRSQIPLSHDLFDIDFELNISPKESDELSSSDLGETMQPATLETSFIGEILSLPSKIINKLNG